MITTSLELALLVLCVEFGLVAVVIMFVSRRTERQQQNTAVENVTSLVATVEKTEVHRRDALMATMQEIYRMDAAESEKVVGDFIERERAFYNALIGVTLGRGGKSLADVPAEVTKLVAPWVRITPRGQVEAAQALGATKWEVIRMTVFPYGSSGMIAGSMLGLGRALGETVAVLIILRSAAQAGHWSLFDGGYTFASKIASAAAEFSSPLPTGAYIAAGFVLFILTFIVNALARAAAGGRVSGG